MTSKAGKYVAEPSRAGWLLFELFLGLAGLYMLNAELWVFDIDEVGVGRVAFGAYLVVAFLLWLGLRRTDQMHLGWANAVTGVRAVLVCFMTGVAMFPETLEVHLMSFLALALIALCLDGVDGWVARRKGESSPLGARFDMELDAAFILLLSFSVIQLDKAGVWVLMIGGMRYLFILASLWLPALKKPLYDSWRRKAICVVQVLALMVCLVPLVSASVSAWLAALALLLLVYSFAVDTHWLLQQPGQSRH
ncbi:CDP-alcohol phosphatidyltransferase family protein [Larsenimonas suaedae]|uniref:CDP-alcohol phosphatidyltransferase family protein n=1 Tax=Larsenimonas suaedae TaxID=1851019 RepID=A0ABU1GT98_9GAMM|nr:CDP-alcohol phosphatidyltransferase family protein [Larsenimonas suaedae]MCM2971698.1 CDP-alcohol phosphatidyltransferase family protein [Larsenimonas suaedae]MDR5895250.1 CDP-alcohol phosphatidyltransferase family protein [Larsenimonas suaedae]